VAHLRRYDDLIVLAQSAIECVFFFNPFVRLASRRIDFYREAACDDHVINSRASALRYAECLATVLERAAVSRHAAAPALMHGRAQVSARVERLVNWKEGSQSMGRATILIALAVCATALFFVKVQLPLLSQRAEAAPHTTVFVVSHDGQDGSLLGALSEAGYRATADDAIALANAGVDSDLIVAVGRSGLERPSVSGLIALANSGADTDLITAAARAFGSDVSVSDIVRLQNSGLEASDLTELRSVVCPDASVTDIIALHDAGIDVDYIRHVSSHARLSVRDIIRLHDAGVDS
jgi:hypothetical protein